MSEGFGVPGQVNDNAATKIRPSRKHLRSMLAAWQEVITPDRIADVADTLLAIALHGERDADKIAAAKTLWSISIRGTEAMASRAKISAEKTNAGPLAAAWRDITEAARERGILTIPETFDRAAGEMAS